MIAPHEGKTAPQGARGGEGMGSRPSPCFVVIPSNGIQEIAYPNLKRL